MKLFQQLLVAPAALGLLASGANAANLNINGVSDTRHPKSSSTASPSSRRLSNDWAYQALASLIERYGRVPVTPTAPSVATGP